MNAVVIDDDQLNIDLVVGFLSRFCPEVQVIGQATNIESALEVINHRKPDVLFLDIELHDKTAMDLLNLLNLDGMNIIIISAFDKYALEMYNYPVTHYLLKPLMIDDLVQAVAKVRKNMDKAKQAVITPPKQDPLRYVALQLKDQIYVVDVETIIRLEAHGAYTKIFASDKKVLTSSKSLGDYESLLSRELFLRIHNSHIVNLKQITRYLRTKNGSLVMTDGAEIPISANRKRDLTERIIF